MLTKYVTGLTQLHSYSPDEMFQILDQVYTITEKGTQGRGGGTTFPPALPE